MTGTLASELADGALSFARAHHYTLVDRPRVDLLADPAIERDRHPGRRPVRRPDRRTRGGPVPAAPTPIGDDRPASRADRTRWSTQIPRPRTPARRPARDRPRRRDPRGRHRGRQPDDRAGDRQRLVVLDARVSRHHGRIIGRRGTLVYADLGSTNGSRVNGVPVAEVVLGVGDRIEVGDTVLVVEVAGAPD